MEHSTGNRAIASVEHKDDIGSLLGLSILSLKVWGSDVVNTACVVAACALIAI